LVQIVRGVDLVGDSLHMLGKFDFLLEFLQILRRRFGLHVSSSEETRATTAVMPAAVPAVAVKVVFP
jgi:hypothetical protein